MFNEELYIELVQRLYPTMGGDEFDECMKETKQLINEGSTYESLIKNLIKTHPYDKTLTLKEIFMGTAGDRLIESDKKLLQQLEELNLI